MSHRPSPPRHARRRAPYLKSCRGQDGVARSSAAEQPNGRPRVFSGRWVELPGRCRRAYSVHAWLGWGCRKAAILQHTSSQSRRAVAGTFQARLGVTQIRVRVRMTHARSHLLCLQVGALLEDIAPQGLNAIFDRLR
jgi:hypothetical protein